MQQYYSEDPVKEKQQQRAVLLAIAITVVFSGIIFSSIGYYYGLRNGSAQLPSPSPIISFAISPGTNSPTPTPTDIGSPSPSGDSASTSSSLPSPSPSL